MKPLSPLKHFSFIAILEGISYLLFAITMPLKYVLEMKEPNYYVGMIHGLLFVSYVFLGLRCWIVYKWRLGFVLLALAASIIPFGTFWLERKHLKSRIVVLKVKQKK